MNRTVMGFLAVCLMFCLGTSAAELKDQKFFYDGPYVDVVTELNRRTTIADLEQDGALRIYKVDSRTGLSVPMSMTQYDGNGHPAQSVVNIRLPYNEQIYTLRFENDFLKGYYEPDTSLEAYMARDLKTDEVMMLKLLDKYKLYVAGFLRGDGGTV